MILRVTAFVFCLVWMGAVSQAQEAKKQDHLDTYHNESRAWVKHSNEGNTCVTENAKFTFADVLGEDGRGHTQLLVLQKDHNERREWMDGISGIVSVTTWTLSRSDNRKQRWAIRSPGNTGESLPDLGMFLVSNWPCCSAPYENTYFSLLSGRRLYTTNGLPGKGTFGQDSGLLRIDGGYDGTRYSQTRYVGFGAVGNAAQSNPTLQYGTEKSIKQRISLLGREYGDNFDVPKVQIMQDTKPIEGELRLDGPFDFLVVLQFDDGPEVRIPVKNDVMRADKATLPSGYSLRSEAAQ